MKKSIGFGTRGTLLMIYQMLAYAGYTAFTNFPQNVMSEYYGGTTTTTLMNLIGSLIGYCITYFIIAPNIGKIRSMKRVGIILGIISLMFCAGITLIPPTLSVVWCICFVCVLITTQLWGTFFVTQLIGNWFPRRKGTVMGIVTMSFPIVTGICLSLFMTHFFTVLGTSGSITVAAVTAFSPYWLLSVAGLLICAIWLKDFPEQCGCYRDNDKNFTPEMAREMLERELKARKNSCWKRSKIWACKDWWLQALPCALLLACAMAFMVQIIPVLFSFGEQLNVLAVPGFVLMNSGANAVLFGLSIFACIGSWVLGVLDTKYGTKKAIFITSWVMLTAGVLGTFNNIWTTVAACWLLGIFMGAASNFALSSIVRYWRAEDFPSVMSGAPPLNTVIGAAFPFVIASIASAFTYRVAFGFVGVMAIVCIVCISLFKPKGVAEYDRKLRVAAGLEPDNVLFDRLDFEKRMNARADG